MSFEIKVKDGLGRIGKFTTTHGTIETPVLMPVINPRKLTIPINELESEFKVKMLITNSYIISKNDNLRQIALEKGVHDLLNFNGVIMTDSGTFQMYVHGLKTDEIDPIKIVQFQRDIGSDIGTISDVFSKPDISKELALRDLELSYERGKLGIHEKGDMLLAGTIQGGIYPDLREQSAKLMGSLNFDIHPIGGIVPLMEQYRYTELVNSAIAAKKYLPPQRPVHFFGCGHPMLFALAVYIGADFFDSASYAKYAMDDRFMFTNGTKRLSELTELPCECKACSNLDVSDLKEMPKEERTKIIAKHNLYVSFAEIKRIKQAIREGTLWELVESRVRSHPSLFNAFRALKNHIDYVERFDPITKHSALFMLSDESLYRPEILRFNNRVLERYEIQNKENIIMVTDFGGQPFTESNKKLLGKLLFDNDSQIIYLTPIGVVPIELEHIYPAQQAVFPNILSNEHIKSIQLKLAAFLKKNKISKIIHINKRNVLDNIIKSMSSEIEVEEIEPRNEDISLKNIPEEKAKQKIRAVFDFQFGKGIGNTIVRNIARLKRSSKTKKIRFAYDSSNNLLLSIVPQTGLPVLTIEGAKQLLSQIKPDDYIIRISPDVEEFAREGRSIISKFVSYASDNLRPNEEVFVLSENNNELIALGKSLLSGYEMKYFERGIAVKVRKSIKS